MVLQKFLFLIFIGFCFADISNLISPRKLDESYEFFGRKISDNLKNSDKLMFVGFGNYANQTSSSSFKIYFINQSDFGIETLNFSISIKSTKKEIQCNNPQIIDDVKLSYKCTFDIDNNFTIKQINPNISFTFFNSSGHKLDVTMDNSSFVEESIKTLLVNNEELNYNIFYLEDIEKNVNVYTLTGKINENYTNEKVNLTLSNHIIDCSMNDNKLNFDLSGKLINDTLHGKMAEGNKTKILIYVNNSIIDRIINNIYTINDFKPYIELINFAEFNNSDGDDVTVKAYFRGDSSSLSTNLKKYIKFPVNIDFSDDNTPFNGNASGIRSDINLEKGLVIYNITFPNNENKAIKNIDFGNSFYFSNFEDSNFNIVPIKRYNEDINITNTDKFSYNLIKFQDKNATYELTSFYLDIQNFDYDSDKTNVEKNSTVLLSFIPKDNDNIRDEINCILEIRGTEKLIICKPKKDINTTINTLIIKIVNNTSRLRILNDEDYQTYYSSPNTIGSIDYKYTPLRSPSLRSSSNSLSAGAIVAIVLCTIAAVCAIGIVFFFLNRRPQQPPFKSVNEINIANSTSNIN